MVAGAALFALKVTLVAPRPLGAAPSARPPIVITAAQVEQLRADFSARTGLRPTKEDETALINQAIEEELLYRAAIESGLDRNDHSVRYRLAEKMRFITGEEEGEQDALYREAIELGLDRDDPIIRRMMVEKMRLLAAAPADRTSDDAELQEYLERKPQRYLRPARVTLTHVFLSAQQRAGTAAAAAEALLAVFKGGATSPERAAERGDVFPLGHQFASSSTTELTKVFGASFAAEVMDLPLRIWSGPIASPYGLHLVWIEAREPAQLPPLESVRRQVLQDLRAERRAERLREVIRQLRQQYVVQVEPAAGAKQG